MSQLNVHLSTFKQQTEELVWEKCRLREERDELVQAHREVEEVKEDLKKEVYRSQRQESELRAALLVSGGN